MPFPNFGAMAMSQIRTGAARAGSAVLRNVDGHGSTLKDRERETWLQFDPIVLPTPFEILHAGNVGDLDWDLVRGSLKMQGINYEDKGWLSDHHKRAKVWQGVYEASKERPGLGMLWTALNKRLIDDAFFKQAAKKTGADPIWFNKMGGMFHDWLSEYEINQARNRELINDTEYYEKMWHAGGFIPSEIDIKYELRKEIPGPSDLVRFALKDVFDYANIRKRGWLSDPTPPAFRYWMKQQGFHGTLKIPDSETGAIVELEWADLFWASHWQVIAPGQIYEFLHRFRPVPAGGNQTRFGVKPFTQKDANDWLKIDDYPPEVRDWLKAASYRLPMQRQITAMYRYKIVPLKEVSEIYQDVGYDAKTAGLLAQLEDKRERERQLREARPAAITAVLANYRSGAVTRDAAQTALLTLELELIEINTRMNAVDWQVNNDVATAIIKALRASFLLGVVNSSQARGFLMQAGIAPVRVDSYIALWEAQLTLPRKQLATSQILQLRRDGLISRDDALTRLGNLGWAGAETILLLSENDLNILKDQLKKKEKEQRDARREQQQKRADAKQSATPAMLRDYFLDDLIDVPTLFERLQALGWPVNDILLFIADAQKDKAK